MRSVTLIGRTQLTDMRATCFGKRLFGINSVWKFLLQYKTYTFLTR